MIDLRTLDRLSRVDPSRLNDAQLHKHMRRLLDLHAELLAMMVRHRFTRGGSSLLSSIESRRSATSLLFGKIS